jgi:hypothetical protein
MFLNQAGLTGAEGFDGSSLYLEAALGYTIPMGKNVLQDRNKAIKTEYEAYYHIPLYADIGIGYTILPRFLYGLLSLASTGQLVTRFNAWNDNYGLFSINYLTLGLRYYPFMTGFQLGCDIGYCNQHNIIKLPDWRMRYVSKRGFAIKMSLVYDFDRRLGGSSFALGISAVYGETDLGYGGNLGIWQGAVFIRYLYK